MAGEGVWLQSRSVYVLCTKYWLLHSHTSNICLTSHAIPPCNFRPHHHGDSTAPFDTKKMFLAMYAHWRYLIRFIADTVILKNIMKYGSKTSKNRFSQKAWNWLPFFASCTMAKGKNKQQQPTRYSQGSVLTVDCFKIQSFDIMSAAQVIERRRRSTWWCSNLRSWAKRGGMVLILHFKKLTEIFSHSASVKFLVLAT